MKNFTKLITLIMCTFAVMITTDVKAFQTDCLNFDLFMVDNPLGNSEEASTLYGVDLSTGNAVLNEIFTRDFRFHIAYNNLDDLIYLVVNDGSGFETIDASTGISLGFTDFDDSLGGTTTAVFYNELLYIGSRGINKIVAYDFDTASYSVVVDSGIDVSGGDLVEKDGILYLATRSGNKLHKIVGGACAGYVSIPGSVTGMSLTEDNTILMSNKGSTALNEIALDGSVTMTYPVLLNNEEYTLRNGDMAGGCNLSSQLFRGGDICTTYEMYYSHIKGSNSDLYGVSLNGKVADLNMITTVPGRVHIAFDTTNDNVYAVNEAGTTLTTINSLGEITSIDLADGLSQIVTNVYKNGKLYLGSGTQNKIVEVNIMTGTYNVIATEIPVGGGDLVFRDNDLYLATRTGNRLLKIDTDTNTFTEVANIAAKVNGLALTYSGEFLMSNADTSEFKLLRSDGTYLKTYTAMTGGSPLSLSSGDLAGGCSGGGETIPCETLLVNGGFEVDNNLSGSWDYVPQDQVPGWSTTSAPGTIEIQADMGTGDMIPSNSGDYHFELNGDGLNTLYQGFCTTPGTNLEVTFSHKKRRTSGTDEMTLYVGDDLGTIESTTGVPVFSLDVETWETKTFVFDIPEGQTYTYVYFKAVSGSNNTVGNLLDDISVESTFQSPTNMQAYFASLSTIEQELQVSEISMYPVPANDRLNIKLNSKIGGSVSYEIVSIMGQSFNRGTVEAYSGQTEINTNISRLADGTYFFVVNINGNTTTKQFVKVSR